MEGNKEEHGLLDLMIRPGFCVKDNQILTVNQAAQSLLLEPGMDIRDLLITGQEEYAAFQDGCLYLTLSLAGGSFGACVIRIEELDYFLLDQDSDDDALRAMSLAARVLREPLNDLMATSRQLTPGSETEAMQLAQMNRSMHQILRLLGNMSDAGRSTSLSHPEVRDVTAVFGEIFEKAQTLVEQTGLTLHYQSEMDSTLCLLDGDLLERAVLNILSNAIKFSPKGSAIHAKLSRRGRRLTLSIQDGGSGIAQSLQQTLFSRYLRQPGIEDRRFGLGLGMVLIRNAAAQHGGTVLIDQPGNEGTRVSLTMTIRQDFPGNLRSPMMRIDYTGEQDHGLVELSDCLPLSAYYMD